MSDIKAELKSARECIKKKEFKEALKHCKNILKVDKENYNGLVFIGVCATELEQFEQSRQAYRKAIEVNAEQILAWQGLCTCLEKSKNYSWHSELIEAYTKLLNDHIKDDGKWIEISNKLVVVLKLEKRRQEAVRWLKDSISKNSDNSLHLWKDVISISKEILTAEGSDSSKESLTQLHEAYTSAIAVGVDGQDAQGGQHDIESIAVEYATFLLVNGKRDYPGKLSLNATYDAIEKLLVLYPDNADLLSIFCLVWVYKHIGVDCVVDDNALSYFDKLLQLKPNSYASYLISGVIAMDKKTNQAAMDWFKKASLSRRDSPLVLYIMAKCQFLLHQYSSTLKIIRSCKDVLSNVEFKESFHRIDSLLCSIQINILLEGPLNKSKRKEIEILLKKLNVLKTDDIDIEFLKVRVHTALDDIEAAIEVINRIEENGIDDQWKGGLLHAKALVSIHERKYYDAELRLCEALEIKENYKTYVLLGDVYKYLAVENENDDLGHYPKAYNSYLKAAKLDPYYSPTFLRLGVYQYELIKDMTKAMKCFEKAIALDPSNEEAAKNLGDIYLKEGLAQKAIELYNRVTTNSQPGEAIWAWVRTGLLNLESNPDQAVVCFQHAIRGDTNVSHYWECLAEAYFIKGSFTSSLKAFTRALELDPLSTFCKYKIAKIKQLLSMDNEAIADYEQLLESNPSYVPGLLGLAETHLHLQREKLKATLDGRAVDHSQKVVDCISVALPEQPTYACLWKTIADSLCELHVVTVDKCRLKIPENLCKMLCLNTTGYVNKETIIDIATKCYMMAIKFTDVLAGVDGSKGAATLWNDLAVCTFYHGMTIEGQTGEQKIHQSIDIIKKALSLDPNNNVFWNTLGVIAGSPGPSQKVCGYSVNDIQNPGLSQHAFIKSLEINPQDAQVWSNLGALYMQHDKVKAAHEAFKKAQAVDPSLVEAWVGQAMIAECIGDDEAMDLFRHTTQLSFHGEGSIAYAQWVCRMLKSIKRNSWYTVTTKPTPDMKHLPEYARNIVANASVALQKSVERYKGDPCAYNTLGILLEHQALYKQAEQAFSCARKLLNAQPDRDRQAEMLRMVLTNQARVLCELNKYDDAIEIYNIVSLETVGEYCGLALAYYKSGMLKKCYSVYEKALSISKIDFEKSALLSAMGMVQYAMQDAESAKSCLLKGSQFEDKSEHGLMALSALGLLHGDGTLATAALVELSNHRICNNPSVVEKKAMLMSAFYMLQGQKRAAQRVLAKAILRFPNNAYLWCRMSKYIGENHPSEYKTTIHCSKAASLMGPSKMTSKTNAITSLAFPDESMKRDLIRSVQRFVHSHPEHVESWVLLSTALMADLTTKTSTGASSVVHMTKLALTKVDESLNQLRQTQSNSPSRDQKLLTMYTSLYSWTMQSYVMANIYYGDVITANSFCNQIIPSLQGDNKVQELFIFMKGLATMQGNLQMGDSSGLENIRVMAALATKSMLSWQWKIMAQIYTSFSMLTSAEMCHRHVMKINLQTNKPNISILFGMCLLAIQAYHVSREPTWLNQGLEVIAELMRIDETNPFAIFLRAVLFYQEGKQKAAIKYLQKITFSGDTLVSDLQQSLLEQWK